MITLNPLSPQLKTLLDALPIMIINQQLLIHHCSQALANSIGQRREQLLGQALNQLPGFSADDSWQPDRLHNLSPGRVLEHSFSLFNRLGQSMPYRMQLQAIDLPENGYFMVLITPNTAQHALTQRLQESERALDILHHSMQLELDRHQTTIDHLHWALTERAEAKEHLLRAQKIEVLGRMTAGVAHDFNNLLAIIIGNTELACEDLNDGAYNQLTAYLHQIEIASKRGAALVKKMMQYCRQHHNNAIDIPSDLKPVIEDTASLLLGSLPAGIELLLDLQPVAPTQLDSSDLSQIITNLVINARDAIDNKGWIQLKLHTYTPPSDTICSDCGQHLHANRHTSSAFVCLAISDNGSGIPDQHLKHIFDPFYTTKAVDKGTGLGLSVISGIVHEAGGHIVVNTQIGQGTCFNILLPIPPDAAVPPLNDSVTIKKLLLVDDDQHLLNMVNHSLQKRGYHTDPYSNPQAALKAFRQQPSAYSGLVSDFNMPELNGIELAQALQALQPELITLICSGQEVNLPPELPNAHFLPKPFSLTQLHQVLQSQHLMP
jgi:signal transduction histidine kinase